MRRFVRCFVQPIAAWLVVLFIAPCAFALTIDRKEEALILRGTIEPGDAAVFSRALSSKRTSSVIFENCLGGRIDEGVKIAESIRLADIATAIKGQAMSSCGIAFLAGASRKFESAIGVHLLLLHAATNASPDQDVAPKVNASLRPYTAMLTDGKLSNDLLDLVFAGGAKNQGVVFVQYDLGLWHWNRSYYCNSSEAIRLERCRVLEGSDLFKNGILK